jgi:uncharacterized membrane protein HdeD (DUF308 family)
MSVTTGRGLSGGFDLARRRWAWFVVLGVLLVLAGAFAFFDVITATFFVTTFVGVMLILGGIFQFLHSFAVRGWGSFLLHLLAGVLYVIGGLLIIDEPVAGSYVITAFLAACLIVGGIFRIAIAIGHRHIEGWWYLVLSGIISLLIGVILYLSLPWSALWVLGTLVAVELVVQGVTWVQFGFALRRFSHP